MAEPVSGGGAAGGDEGLFKVLGTVQVDQTALKASLDQTEREVRASAERQGRVWDDVSKRAATGAAKPLGWDKTLVNAVSGGGATIRGDSGEGGGGGGGEGEGGGGRQHSATANFAHMARVVRHTLIPALSQISPSLGQFISVGAQSARTAVFFGAAIGGIAIAGAAASAVIGKYVEAAKAATAATLDSGQALRTWDDARADAGIKRITEAVAEYTLQTKIASGDVEGGLWQQIVAYVAKATEAVTGGVDQQLAALEKYEKARVAIGEKYNLPKIRAEADKGAALTLGEDARLAVKDARSQGELAAAYDLLTKSINDATAADLKRLSLDREKEKVGIGAGAADVREKQLADLRAVEEAAGDISQRIKARAAGDAETLVGDLARTVTLANGVGVSAAEADLASLAKLLADAEKIKAGIEESRGRTGKRRGEVEAGEAKDRADLAEKNRITQKKAEVERLHTFAENVAVEEGLVQKRLDRNQRRVEGEAATAEAIAGFEEKVAEARRAHAGVVESAAALEDRLAASRKRGTDPIVSAIETENGILESQLVLLRARIDAGLEGARGEEKYADAVAAGAAKVADLRRSLAKEEAAQDAKATAERDARVKAQVADEDRRFTHRVSMGRATMQEEMAFQRRASDDPARSQDQREAAESRFYEAARQYADSYFKYFGSLGASTWDAQVESARSFLGGLEVGSAKWFEQTRRVYDLYKGIADQAKGIFQTQLSTAEQEKQRSFHVPTLDELRGRVSVGDIPDLLAKARERDEGLLTGGKTEQRPGDLAAAIGRMGEQGLWRTMDRERLSPAEAFARMQEGPEDKLRQLTGSYLSGAGAQSAGGAGFAEKIFGGAVDRFASAVDRFSANEATVRKLEEGIAMAQGKPTYQKDSRGVLRSITDRSNTEISGADDSALGRNLFLSSKRGPNMTESFS